MRGRQREPGSTPVGRFLRGRRLDDNPLRRAYDRAETLVLIVLATVFLVAAPLVATASGAWAHATAQRAAIAQTTSQRQVTAVVLTAPAPPPVGSGGFVFTARAQWRAPGGAVVTGQVPVPANTSVGAKVSVWTTRDGRPAVPPLSESQVHSLTVLGTVTGVVALVLALALAGGLARWSLNKRRMAGWDADWQATEPRWTTRA
jgi:hypothetical protein